MSEFTDLAEYERRGVSDEDIALSVKQGIYWFDENVEGWYKVVDVVAIDLSATDSCMLGQQWVAEHGDDTPQVSPYWDFLMDAQPDATNVERGRWAAEHGFNLAFVPNHTDQDWVELDEEWKHQVTLRQEADDITP